MATGSVPAAPVILVVGATGDLGQRVVRRLQKGGHQVRALVRPNSDPGSTVPEGVGIVRGDLRDPASLFAACEGVSTVVLTATAIGRRLAGERVSIRDVDQRGGLALVGATESAGVQRFVYMSFLGAEDSPSSSGFEPAPCNLSLCAPMRSKRFISALWRGSTSHRARCRSLVVVIANGAGLLPRT